jgi:predicted metal-dependent hydrolase
LGELFQLLLFFEENNKRYITKDEKKMEELWEWTGKEFKEHGL